MLKKLYNKSIELAAKKSANHYLALISFIESSFFPIPPDVMIVPMVMARKENYVKIFLNATIFSVLGGLLGYVIGYLFIDVAMYVVELYGYENKVSKLKINLTAGNLMVMWLGTLFLAGFTPLPFKVFTITSGLIEFNLLVFLIVCIISRGLRFFLVSFLTAKFGEKFIKLIERKGALWSCLIGAVIVSIFLLIYFFIK